MVGEIIFVVQKKIGKRAQPWHQETTQESRNFSWLKSFRNIPNYIAVLIINNHHVSKLYGIIIGFHLFLAISTITYLFNQ